jgi:hypothetical protein
MSTIHHQTAVMSFFLFPHPARGKSPRLSNPNRHGNSRAPDVFERLKVREFFLPGVFSQTAKKQEKTEKSAAVIQSPWQNLTPSRP